MNKMPRIESQPRVNYVTPKYDITWYVKWIVSVILLFGLAVGERGASVEGWGWVDNVCSWIGAAGWWWVGYRWNDRALMLVNGVFVFVLTGGLLRLWLG